MELCKPKLAMFFLEKRRFLPSEQHMLVQCTSMNFNIQPTDTCTVWVSFVRFL